MSSKKPAAAMVALAAAYKQYVYSSWSWT